MSAFNLEAMREAEQQRLLVQGDKAALALKVAGAVAWAITRHERDGATMLTVKFSDAALREALAYGWGEVVKRAEVLWEQQNGRAS